MVTGVKCLVAAIAIFEKVNKKAFPNSGNSLYLSSDSFGANESNVLDIRRLGECVSLVRIAADNLNEFGVVAASSEALVDGTDKPGGGPNDVF
jgi:hypothetical protein